MNAYQLSCGHWETDRDSYEIGGVYLCPRHGRATVIGKVSAPRFPPQGGAGQ